MTRTKCDPSPNPMDKPTKINVHIGGNVDQSQVITGRSVRVERSPGKSGVPKGRKPRLTPAQKKKLAALDPRQLELFHALRDQFDLEGIELICWEMGIRFDDLGGKGLTGKAYELVKLSAALNLLDKLAAIVQRERPSASSQ
jgi:effector-associated domain 7 (EAD7)-containing protein